MNRQDEHKRRNKIIKAIIIIIIILLLITSCNSKFFGRIGSSFNSSSSYTIKGQNDKLIILNKNLRFTAISGETSMDIKSYKIGYITDGITDSNITCTTSDASIATCLVRNDYVEVYPKSDGCPIIFIEKEANGKIYRANHNLVIGKSNKKITLSENSKTLYLSESNILNIVYDLNGINGKVKVIVEKPDIADAKAEDGILKIVGKKSGTTKITLTVEENGKEYEKVFELIIEKERPSSNKTTKKTTKKTNIKTTKKKTTKKIKTTKKTTTRKTTTTKKKTTKTTNNTTVNTSRKPTTTKVLSSNNLLKGIALSKGSLIPSFDKNTKSYNIIVNRDINQITLTPELESNKSKIDYYINGAKVNNLNDINLEPGDNLVEIVVIAEDNSTNKYSVNIKRKKDENNLLKNLSTSSGALNPGFNKDINNYHINVNNDVKKISFNSEKESANSKTSYTLNGNKVNSLDDLDLKVGDNELKIIVTSEKGETNTYTVIISRKADSNNNLKYITTNKGSLSPSFDKSIKNYVINVDNDITNITLNSEMESKTSKVKYTYKGKTVSNLNDLSLDVGDNLVEIIVTSESESTNKYSVNIKRKVDENNYLSGLSIENVSINPIFDKNTLEYFANVNYNNSTIKVNVEKESINSLISYKVNREDKDNLNNVSLKEGENIIEVNVTNGAGVTRTYKIKVTRATRTIKFDKENVEGIIEKSPINVTYKIFEGQEERQDYSIDDIDITDKDGFKGELSIEKGVLVIKPISDDIGNTYKFGITYTDNGAKATIEVKIIEQDYIFDFDSSENNIEFTSNDPIRTLPFNTNMFMFGDKEKPLKTDITNGIELTGSASTSFDTKSKLRVVSKNPDVGRISYDPNEPEVFSVNLLKSGKVEIELIAEVNGHVVKKVTKVLNLTREYLVELHANGGKFKTEDYNKKNLITKNNSIDLREYLPTKAIDEDNCYDYKIDSYNTSEDGKGTKYNLEKITINSDIKLYAIYKEEKDLIEDEVEKKVYLTEVDLFKNESYYKLYNIEKMIYPGAYGYHNIEIENNLNKRIKITKITLEEDTICVTDGCINIGYVIKSSNPEDNNLPNYYYGGPDNYEILNKDPLTQKGVSNSPKPEYTHTYREISISPAIEIEKGKEREIPLLWLWVDSDKIDTEIGNKVATIESLDNNNKRHYQLTVSIDYIEINDKCNLEKN